MQEGRSQKFKKSKTSRLASHSTLFSFFNGLSAKEFTMNNGTRIFGGLLVAGSVAILAACGGSPSSEPAAEPVKEQPQAQAKTPAEIAAALVCAAPQVKQFLLNAAGTAPEKAQCISVPTGSTFSTALNALVVSQHQEALVSSIPLMTSVSGGYNTVQKSTIGSTPYFEIVYGDEEVKYYSTGLLRLPDTQQMVYAISRPRVGTFCAELMYASKHESAVAASKSLGQTCIDADVKSFYTTERGIVQVYASGEKWELRWDQLNQKQDNFKL